MKNDSLKNLIFIFVLSLIMNFKVYGNEIEFSANQISTYEKGNLTIGKGEAKAKINNQIEIFAEKFEYNKEKKTITAIGKAKVIDLINKIDLTSEKVTYYQLKNFLIAENNVKIFDKINKVELITNKIEYYLNQKEINTFKNTSVKFKKKYNFQGKNLSYNIIKKELFTNQSSTFSDDQNNLISFSKFKYSLNTEIIKGENIKFKDYDNNIYLIKKGFADIQKKELIGKDIKVNLRNDLFGIIENEPKLAGKSISYKNNRTVIKKGVFTTCQSDNDCPPWKIKSNQIIHDKEKKEIIYKNAWLNLYNKPIFYFPKFFHPDPSVERRSGFLMPTFGNSKKLGSSVTIPYFHAISESSDFTYKPRFFSETEYLLQSEFRKVSKKSSHIFDVSVNKEKNQNVNGSKTHFFSNSELSIENDFFDESNLNLKIEKVSNDDYTKLYSLESTSPIIKDTNTLESSISYSANTEDIFFDISLESYETMKKTNNDRYEFVYPNYTISKLVEINSALFETINLSSSGSQKKYNTNIYEGVQINDLLLQTKNFISNIGINHEFKTIIKNVNSDGKNSKKYKDNSQSEILNLNSYTISNPLFKEDYDSKNYLTPKLSLRYSPNDTKNIKSESRYLNSGNIFSLNRIGYSDNIEGGSSLTLGLDFKKTDKKENEILNAKIATVFREEKDDNLPTTSTLGKKQSDYVGSVELIPSEFLNFSYDYSINNDFDENNLHDFKTTFKMNNFVNEFVFFEENNLIGDKSYYENTFSYKFDQQNSFSFKTRENKKNNLTEFYKLIYEYKNDCLTASIRYNKEYYSNSTLKPNEELFFNITLIPLGATETESLID